MHPKKLIRHKQYLLVRYKRHFIMEYLGNHKFKYLKCIYDDAFIIPAIPTNHIRKLMTYIIIEQLFELDEFVESISEL